MNPRGAVEPLTLAASRVPATASGNNAVELMGIINVTPDSFWDGGRYLSPERAVGFGLEHVAAGASLVDVGAESTRPGAERVPPADQIDRLDGVICQLVANGIRVSIDTTRASVAKYALAAGATMVNDVSAFRDDPVLVELVAEADCSCCIMHMQGDPRTMQRAPRYGNVLDEVCSFLEQRASWAVDRGVNADRIWVDPGIGFGKSTAHNLELLRGLPKLASLGFPVLVGTSRKSLHARITGHEEPDAVLVASAVSALMAARAGARMLRVHDVAATAAGLAMCAAIEPGSD